MVADHSLHPIKSSPVTEDRPIASEADDRLDRASFIDGLIRALLIDERDPEGRLIARRSTNHVVGLTGPWGSGKSSIINLLELKLGSMDRVLVTTINPWLFNGRDELLSAFFSSLRSALGKSRSEKLSAAISALDRYQDAVGVAAQIAAAYTDLHGTGGKASALVKQARQNLKALIKKQRELSPAEERASLEKKIAVSRQAIVVLVDELDRVEDTEVKAVAQMVKAVGDIRGISYLVSYDPERVIDALGRGSGEERRKTGEAYLEKIIQHPIPLRPLLDTDVRALLDICFQAEGIELPEFGDQNGNEILDLIIRKTTTPREIKRLIGAFSILNRMTRGELYAYDVLGYCWIITKSPTLKNKLVQQMTRLVDDPAGDHDLLFEIFQESQAKETNPEAILGPAASEHDQLLRLLFPALDKNSSKENRGTRISKRRNLLRLLYLGDPPGSISRDDVKATLSAGRDTAFQAVRNMLQAGTLSTFLDKVDDDTDTLPEDRSDAFWIGLADGLVRDHDWLTGPEAERSIADEAQEMLLRLGLRSTQGERRAKHLVETLIAHGDLVIVPGFLRRHMFQHGLVVGETPRGGRTTLDKGETESLLAREMPRYRTALLNGRILRRLPDVEALFVISNAGAWDEELHASLTDQLSSPEAIQSLAGLLVPPGWGIEKKTLYELFDGDAILGRIHDFQAQGSFNSDPWIQQCIKNLRMTLAGKNPAFDSE